MGSSIPQGHLECHTSKWDTLYYQGQKTIKIRFNLKYKLFRNLILVQAETTWLPVNDNYKEINLESEEMEIYGHWFNMKKLLSLRKTVSASYPTWLKILSLELLDSFTAELCAYDIKVDILTFYSSLN